MTITLPDLTDEQLADLYDRWQRTKQPDKPFLSTDRLEWISEKLRLSSYIPSWREQTTLDYAKTLGIASLNRGEMVLIEDIARKAIMPITVWEDGGDNVNDDTQADSDTRRSDTG